MYGYCSVEDLDKLVLANQVTVLDAAKENLFKAFATCHSLLLMTDGQLFGEPLELALFKFSKVSDYFVLEKSIYLNL